MQNSIEATIDPVLGEPLMPSVRPQPSLYPELLPKPNHPSPIPVGQPSQPPTCEFENIKTVSGLLRTVEEGITQVIAMRIPGLEDIGTSRMLIDIYGILREAFEDISYIEENGVRPFIEYEYFKIKRFAISFTPAQNWEKTMGAIQIYTINDPDAPIPPNGDQYRYNPQLQIIKASDSLVYEPVFRDNYYYCKYVQGQERFSTPSRVVIMNAQPGKELTAVWNVFLDAVVEFSTKTIIQPLLLGYTTLPWPADTEIVCLKDSNQSVQLYVEGLGELRQRANFQLVGVLYVVVTFTNPDDPTDVYRFRVEASVLNNVYLATTNEYKPQIKSSVDKSILDPEDYVLNFAYTIEPTHYVYASPTEADVTHPEGIIRF